MFFSMALLKLEMLKSKRLLAVPRFERTLLMNVRALFSYAGTDSPIRAALKCIGMTK